MIYISIMMALIGNIEFEKNEINQTWILRDISPKGWHSSAEKNDVLKFTEDSMIEMISIEEGPIRKVKYTLNDDNEIILESGVNFGKIKSLDKNQLVIQKGDEESKIEKIYSLLPITQLEIPEAKIIEEIRNHQWKAEMERPNNRGIMIWTLEAHKDDNFEIQLITGSKNVKINMPAKLKKIENCFFLSCQIPDFKEVENYVMPKINKDEIQLSFGLGNAQKTITFKKEK